MVVAHDAGGANVLAALARKYRDAFEWCFAVGGPALAIMQQSKFAAIHRLDPGSVEDIIAILEALPQDLVLTGSGWASDLERLGIRAARQQGLRVLTYLDHWVNYRERFAAGAGWRAALPDAVLVGDGFARDRALQDGFPGERLIAVENPYLTDFFKRSACAALPIGSERTRRLLFLSEPVGAAPFATRGPGDGVELLVVRALTECLRRESARAWALSIRLHPSDSRDKYAALIASLGCADLQARIEAHEAPSRPLDDDCMLADRVLGVSSMALLVAAALGRPTFSYQADGAERFALPQRGIIPVRSAADLAQVFIETLPPTHGIPVDFRLFTEPFDCVIERQVGKRYESR